MQVKNRFYRYLVPLWKIEAVIISLSGIVALLSLVNPYLAKLAIDRAYAGKDLRLLMILAAIGGGVFIVNSLAGSLSDYLSERMRRVVNFDISKGLFNHLQRLSLNFFNERTGGEYVYKMIGDAGSVGNFISEMIPRVIALLPRLILILAIVLHLNWKLAVFALALMPFNAAYSYLAGGRLRKINRRLVEKSQNIFEILYEVFSHMRLVKALGKEEREMGRYAEEGAKNLGLELDNAKASGINSFVAGLLNKAVAGLVMLYGGYQVINGEATLGNLTAVLIYLGQLTGLMHFAGNLYQDFMLYSVSERRLEDIFRLKPEVEDKKGANDISIPISDIELKEVRFGYVEGRDVLDGLNFSIKRGSKIAIVGSSGCGKTTLINLILRLYEPKAGAVLIDGIDMREVRIKSLQRQTGVALQEPFLWNDTIANNILYGAQRAGAEDVVTAARLAEAHGFIMSLPKGYGSNIGEMACKLSEGQKQRIAIARALIKRPEIIILDEAMSSLDSETEDDIIDNIKREFADSIIIIVSHRLSAAKKMDKIYYLEGLGKVDIGSHEDLSYRNPKYRELFGSQIGESAPCGFKA